MVLIGNAFVDKAKEIYGRRPERNPVRNFTYVMAMDARRMGRR